MEKPKGGTNFSNAFDKIFEVLRGSKKKNYNNATIVFLTDGLPTGDTTDKLIDKLQCMVLHYFWNLINSTN